MFVVDEVGQFVARDVQKMLDLQAVVQSLGVKGRGKHWVVVTSQEKLGELVSGLDDKKIELARLMDRFPLQVHLEPSDISEVTSRRVLSKNAAAQAALGKLFDEHRGRLTEHTRLTADIKLPEVTREAFIDLYPLCRTRSTSSSRSSPACAPRAVPASTSAARTAPSSSSRSSSSSTRREPRRRRSRRPRAARSGLRPRRGQHRLRGARQDRRHLQAGRPPAGAAGGEGHLPAPVREERPPQRREHRGGPARQRRRRLAARLREGSAPGARAQPHQVRHGDDGYRIPTPAEDDWERLRNGISPKPGDSHRLYQRCSRAFWQPQPSHTLFDTKTFKAGLAIHGRELTAGDMMFQVHLAEDGKEFDGARRRAAHRSQQERKHVFWAIALTDAIDRETVELFRSKEMLARKERETKGEDTPALIAEERVRLRRHGDELRRLLKAACLSGRIYFRGNDRSPTDRAVDVGKTAAEVLGTVLPEVFDRFKEAAAKATT
jgi:hypothetical protein